MTSVLALFQMRTWHLFWMLSRIGPGMVNQWCPMCVHWTLGVQQYLSRVMSAWWFCRAPASWYQCSVTHRPARWNCWLANHSGKPCFFLIPESNKLHLQGFDFYSEMRWREALVIVTYNLYSRWFRSVFPTCTSTHCDSTSSFHWRKTFFFGEEIWVDYVMRKVYFVWRS